jgi:hypothetical protein
MPHRGTVCGYVCVCVGMCVGEWWLRLSIDLEHQGDDEGALAVAEQSQKDPWIRHGDLMALQVSMRGAYSNVCAHMHTLSHLYTLPHMRMSWRTRGSVCVSVFGPL